MAAEQDSMPRWHGHSHEGHSHEQDEQVLVGEVCCPSCQLVRTRRMNSLKGLRMQRSSTS